MVVAATAAAAETASPIRSTCRFIALLLVEVVEGQTSMLVTLAEPVNGCGVFGRKMGSQRPAARPPRISAAGRCRTWRYPVPAHRLTYSGSPAAPAAFRIGLVK